jgi:predicted Rossmann-fold nucleotide-binding protein
VNFLHDRSLGAGMIDPADYNRILLTDSAEEAVRSVTEVALPQFGLTYGPQAKRRWYLWE